MIVSPPQRRSVIGFSSFSMHAGSGTVVLSLGSVTCTFRDILSAHGGARRLVHIPRRFESSYHSPAWVVSDDVGFDIRFHGRAVWAPCAGQVRSRGDVLRVRPFSRVCQSGESDDSFLLHPIPVSENPLFGFSVVFVSGEEVAPHSYALRAFFGGHVCKRFSHSPHPIRSAGRSGDFRRR